LSFGDLSGGNDGGDDASFADAASDGDLVSDSGSPDALATDSGNPGDGGCSGTSGPTPIPVGSSGFCIDSTEVTYRQYKQFLAALDAGATVTQPSYCSWNTTFVPVGTRSGDDLPMSDADWCDAHAYCEWAGKHLCGKIGGGSLPTTSFGDPTSSQWLAACAHAPDGGLEQYPYGDTYVKGNCNGSDIDSGTVFVVGSEPKCVGGYANLYDMSGNVDEWLDSCDGTTGADDCCLSAGGGYNDYGSGISCGVGDIIPPSCPGRTRQDAHGDLGFRCCSN
jgi:formylglycine-generating enzyme required for sulfatase activity